MDTKTYTPQSFFLESKPCDDYSEERIRELLGKRFNIFDIVLNSEIEPLDIFYHIIDRMFTCDDDKLFFRDKYVSEKKEFKNIVNDSGLFPNNFHTVNRVYMADDQTSDIYIRLKGMYTNEQIEEIIFYYRELLHSYMLELIGGEYEWKEI